MRDAFKGNILNALNGDMLWKRGASKAVAFVTNQDTDEIISGKLLAYAYTLPYEGCPAVCCRDYADWLDKNMMNNLIWIHNNNKAGSTSALYVGNDEYIAQRNGNLGLAVYQ